jgi:bifunctional DNA-binding transcriptional regulator/antitoxin component of YhaV-PrlF toxin-antitoxin module
MTHTTSITEDGKFFIPPYIQSQTGLFPGANVVFEVTGSALLVRLSEHVCVRNPEKKVAFWNHVGSIKFEGKYNPESDQEAAMEAVAAHVLGEEA